MSISDTQAEFDRLRQLMAEGSAHLEKRDFQKAQSLLFQALRQLEALGLEKSEDRLVCLNQLGDAYYADKRFIEARAVYQQLESALEQKEDAEPQEKARTAFKVANATDKVQDFDSASEAFARSYEFAQSSLSLGDPLLTELLEAYSGFLRRSRGQPDKLKEMERMARLSRQKQLGIESSLFDPQHEEKRRKRKEEADLAFAQLRREQKLIVMAKRHPKISLFVLSSPVTVAIFFLITVVSAAVLGIDIGATVPLEARQYSTTDGAITLLLISPRQAMFHAEKDYPVQIRQLNRWSELIESMRMSQSKCWLQKDGERLLTEYGFNLYAPHSCALQTRSRMQALGQVMLIWRKEKTEKPDMTPLKPLKSNGFQFRIAPFADQDRLLPAQIKQLKELSEFNFLLWLESGRDEALTGLNSEAKFSGLPPILVQGYYDKKALAVVAYSSNMARMKTSDGKRYQLYSTTDWQLFPLKFNDQALTTSRLDGVKSILVSTRSRSEINQKYFHLFSSMLVLVFLILNGAMLFKKSREEAPQLEYYYPRPNQLTLEGYLWTFFTLMCMFYLAYIGWIVLS